MIILDQEEFKTFHPDITLKKLVKYFSFATVLKYLYLLAEIDNKKSLLFMGISKN